MRQQKNVPKKCNAFLLQLAPDKLHLGDTIFRQKYKTNKESW